MLRHPGHRGVQSLSLLGHRVCNKAFIRLLALGKSRFLHLRSAALEGNRVCPMDKRFIPHKKDKAPSKKRAFVYDFLDNLYVTVAEALPDSARNNKRPRSFMEPPLITRNSVQSSFPLEPSRTTSGFAGQSGTPQSQFHTSCLLPIFGFIGSFLFT